MPRLRDKSAGQVKDALTGAGLRLLVGDICFRLIDTSLLTLPHLLFAYRDYQIDGTDDADDFVIRIIHLRRAFREDLITVDIDGPNPINPLPAAVAPMMLEMAMNWAIAGTCDYFLTLHSAVLEKEGRTLVLPAHSGSGKSTLAAALMMQGWRLLSDEFGLVDLDHAILHPLPRPVSLKNASIEVMRARCSDDVIGPDYSGTAKGRVSYVRPTTGSADCSQPAAASLMLIPHFMAGSPCRVDPVLKSEMLLRLVEGAANYERLGERGFHALLGLLDRCTMIGKITYGDLDEAMAKIETLFAAQRAGEAA